jgi:flagellar biogenesis protein FliO
MQELKHTMLESNQKMVLVDKSRRWFVVGQIQKMVCCWTDLEDERTLTVCAETEDTRQASVI